MTNKDFYIEEQLFFSRLNKLLILENPNEIIKDLLNDYEINKIINNIESYMEKLENICFISYFDEERQKLIEIIQIIIFAKKRDLKYNEDIDDEYIGEEAIEKMLEQTKYLQNLNTSNKEMYETTMLSYRHLKNTKNTKFILKLCYLIDEEVIKYINYNDEKITINDSNYKFYISSLFHYYYTITLTLDKNSALNKIKKIIFYKYPELQIERLQLFCLIKKMLNMEYTELGYDDLCNDLYLGIDNSEPSIYKFKDNIINIKKYKKR